MILLSDIHKTFVTGSLETHVLKGVTLEVLEGEYVALMGSSGTGKSTLMNILGCLDRATDGRYTMDGTDVGKMSDIELSSLRNSKVGFVFQQFHLLPRSTALANVLLPLVYSSTYPREARKRAEGLLAMVGLRDRIHYLPSQLSGGQKQRVAIARALINEPRIILADEPTGNLDLQSTNDIMEVLDRLHAAGNTIITVTHDPETADRAQRVVVMEDGQIVEDRRTGATP
jgi:putative ABC transport system ATP-binding protein